MIPNIIHQIFFDLGKGKKFTDFPLFVKYHNKQKEINNNFTVYLWNEEQIENIVKKYEFYNIYKNFRYQIQKVDLAKYLLLYEYGGVYLDLDLEPLRNISDLLDKNILLCNSPREHCQNNCIGSEKKNPLFLDLINYSINEYQNKKDIEVYNTWQSRFIIQTTGPKMMARFFKQYKNIPINKIIEVPDFKEYVDNPYFRDYCTKTWMPKIFYNNNNHLNI